jgi:hypothetical protein
MKKLLLASMLIFVPGVALAQNQGNVAPVAVVKPLPLPVIVSNPPDQSTNAFITNPGDIAHAQGIGTPVHFQLTWSAVGNTLPQRYTVPAGQRLVIEYISGSCQAFDSWLTSLLLEVITPNPGGNAGEAAYYMTHVDRPPATQDPVFNNFVKIYAGPSDLIVLANGGGGGLADESLTCAATASGQLVAVP